MTAPYAVNHGYPLYELHLKQNKESHFVVKCNYLAHLCFVSIVFAATLHGRCQGVFVGCIERLHFSLSRQHIRMRRFLPLVDSWGHRAQLSFIAISMLLLDL